MWINPARNQKGGFVTLLYGKQNPYPVLI